MNKELSHILKEKLKTLPFVDVLAGMAQTLTMEDVSETGAVTVSRFPVSYDHDVMECEGAEISLLPDSSKKSIIYFEDFGISTTGRLHGQTGYSSNVRLVAWINRAKLVGDHYKEISGRVMATIIDVLAGKNPQNIGMFTRLTIEVARIQPQDAGIFGKYTYKETDRQYLRPPFEFFAIDFIAKFYVPAKCLDGINWDIEKCL